MTEHFETYCLASTRLRLVPLEMPHVPALQAIGSDEVFRYVREIEPPFDAEAWVRSKLESTTPLLAHVVSDKFTKNIVGFVQIEIRSGASEYVYELGYWIGRPYWRKRYGTEAVATALQYLLSPLAQLIHRPIYALGVHSDNIGSRRILERCGFELCNTTPSFIPPDGRLSYRLPW